MRRLIFTLLLIVPFLSSAQFFTMKHPYSGSHYGFKKINAGELNKFVVDFNQMWAADLTTSFAQYDGGEFGQTFTTSGMRFVWGKKEMKWTFSTDYALGFGKNVNEAVFKNGITQRMEVRYTSNQINNTFGISLKENRIWLEGLYCTNLSNVFIEYSTIHLSKAESFGPEYKLNGLYKGLLKTMEFGAQASYRWKKRYVFYGRILLPLAIVGPDENERGMTDAQSKQADPRDFPSNYNSYVNDPAGHIAAKEGLTTNGFKGFSYGFGLLIYVGKIEE